MIDAFDRVVSGYVVGRRIIDERIFGQSPWDRRRFVERFAGRRIRITSYNVCYTKLLRSLGLGLPFIFAGLLFHEFLVFFNRFKRYIRLTEIVAGVLMMAVGILLFFDLLGRLTGYMYRLFPVITSYSIHYTKLYDMRRENLIRLAILVALTVGITRNNFV